MIQGIKRIVAIEGEPSPNCPSSNSTFTYDDQGLLTSKRDNNGNLTTYQYNARGLETRAPRPPALRRRAPSQPTGTRPCSSGAGQRARPDHPLPVRRRGTQDRRDRHHPLTRTTPMRIPHTSPPRRPRPGLRPGPARAGGRARLELQLQRPRPDRARRRSAHRCAGRHPLCLRQSRQPDPGDQRPRPGHPPRRL